MGKASAHVKNCLPKHHMGKECSHPNFWHRKQTHLENSFVNVGIDRVQLVTSLFPLLCSAASFFKKRIKASFDAMFWSSIRTPKKTVPLFSASLSVERLAGNLRGILTDCFEAECWKNFRKSGFIVCNSCILLRVSSVTACSKRSSGKAFLLQSFQLKLGGCKSCDWITPTTVHSPLLYGPTPKLGTPTLRNFRLVAKLSNQVDQITSVRASFCLQQKNVYECSEACWHVCAL